MNERIIGKPPNDEVVAILLEYQGNPQDYDVCKCAAELREIVRAEVLQEPDIKEALIIALRMKAFWIELACSKGG